MLTVVFPGAGQLLQQRWFSAALFLGLAIILITALIILALYPMATNLAIVLEMRGHSSSEPLVTSSIPTILVTGGAAITLCLVSIVDAAVAYRRRLLRWRRAQREHEAPSSNQ